MLLPTPAVRVGGELRSVSRRREQAVLARLAIAAPHAVTLDAIVEDVWGDAPPATAVDAVRVHVSNLRKLFADGERRPSDVLRTTQGGYRLDLDPAAVDVRRIERAVERDEPEQLVSLIVHGVFDHDLAGYDSGSGWFHGVARHADELLAAAAESLARHDLAAGRSAVAVRLLERLVGAHSRRESAWELLVRALADADRRTESLAAAQRARFALAEAGVSPGAGILAAETAVFDTLRATERSGVSRYAEVDGSRIAYEIVGDGPLDLLLLHGGFIPFDTMRDTPRLARFLHEVEARFRVVLLDRRGVGMSDGPVDGGPVRLEHWVDDATAVLRDCGSRSVVLLGHEHGGPVAIRLAAELGDRVKGLVLHSTAARPLRGSDHPFGPEADHLERIDRMIDRLPGSEDLLRVVAPSAGDDPQLRAWMDRAGRLGATPARAKELHRMYLHVDVRDDLSRITCPTYVLHPARMIRNDPGQARSIAEAVPGAELTLLDSSDHLWWVNDADTRSVLDVLDRIVGLDGVRSKREVGASSMGLRALVAVTPADEAVAAALHDLGARSSASVGSAVVAVFDALATARAAQDELRRRRPELTTRLEVGDTSGRSDDPAIVDLAAAVERTAATGRSGPSTT